MHDRDPLVTVTFRETLASAGVEAVRLPPRSPNLKRRADRRELQMVDCPGLRGYLTGTRRRERTPIELLDNTTSLAS